MSYQIPYDWNFNANLENSTIPGMLTKSSNGNPIIPVNIAHNSNSSGYTGEFFIDSVNNLIVCTDGTGSGTSTWNRFLNDGACVINGFNSNDSNNPINSSVEILCSSAGYAPPNTMFSMTDNAFEMICTGPTQTSLTVSLGVNAHDGHTVLGNQFFHNRLDFSSTETYLYMNESTVISSINGGTSTEGLVITSPTININSAKFSSTGNFITSDIFSSNLHCTSTIEFNKGSDNFSSTGSYWIVGIQNTPSTDGTNKGADYVINRYGDVSTSSGNAYIDTPFQISRDSGLISIKSLTASNNITSGTLSVSNLAVFNQGFDANGLCLFYSGVTMESSLQISGVLSTSNIISQGDVNITGKTYCGQISIDGGSITSDGSGLLTSKNITVTSNISTSTLSVSGTSVTPTNYALLSGSNTFSSENHFGYSATFTDPDAGVSRDAKFGNSGIAVIGGIKSDKLSVTGITTLDNNAIRTNGSGNIIINDITLNNNHFITLGTNGGIILGNGSPITTSSGGTITTGNGGTITTGSSGHIITGTGGNLTVSGVTTLDNGSITTNGSGQINLTKLISSGDIISESSITSSGNITATGNIYCSTGVYASSLVIDGETSSLDGGKITTDGNGNIEANSISVSNGIAGRHYGIIQRFTDSNKNQVGIIPPSCAGGSIELVSGLDFYRLPDGGSSGTPISYKTYNNTIDSTYTLPEGSQIFLINGTSSDLTIKWNFNSSNNVYGSSGTVGSLRVALAIKTGSANWFLIDVGSVQNNSSAYFTIPNCKFASLPSASIGMQYLVTDGCKPGEASGAGTGVLCVYDGSNWMNVSSGTTVTI